MKRLARLRGALAGRRGRLVLLVFLNLSALLTLWWIHHEGPRHMHRTPLQPGHAVV